MTIKFHCPSCNALIRAPDNAAGQSGKCKHCGKRVLVPLNPAISDADILNLLGSESTTVPIQCPANPQQSAPNLESSTQITPQPSETRNDDVFRLLESNLPLEGPSPSADYLVEEMPETVSSATLRARKRRSQTRQGRQASEIDSAGLIVFLVIHELLIPLSYGVAWTLLELPQQQPQVKRPQTAQEPPIGILVLQFYAAYSLIANFCFLFRRVGIRWWEGLVPVLNAWRFCEVGGLPGEYSLLWSFCMCPIIPMVALYGIGRNFGLSAPISVGLILVWPLALPVLIFGSKEYTGEYKQ